MYNMKLIMDLKNPTWIINSEDFKFKFITNGNIEPNKLFIIQLIIF
jgi:hypothetical protein